MSGQMLRRVHLVVLFMLAVGAIRAMAGPGEKGCRIGLQHSCIYSAGSLSCLCFLFRRCTRNTPGLHAAEGSRSETVVPSDSLVWNLISLSSRCCYISSWVTTVLVPFSSSVPACSICSKCCHVRHCMASCAAAIAYYRMTSYFTQFPHTANQ